MSQVILGVKLDYKQAVDDYNKVIKQLGGKTIDVKVNPVSGKITQKVIKDTGIEIDKVVAKSEKLEKTNKKVESSQTKLNKSIKESEGLFSRFGNSLRHDIGAMTEWAIAGTAIFGTLRKISEGFDFITKMDKSLAEIRMASGMTREETAGLAREYNNLAKQLGITTEEIGSTAVELYRQGLNTEQVNEKMADYIKLSKVAGETLQTTIEMGTAGTNTFGVSVERLGDIASKTGDSVASSTNEILIAIQKSGSSAQTAGVGLEELAASAAVLGSTTRESGAIVGNSLKSIFSKLSQINELGEVNDEYGKTISNLQEVGIQVTDTNGNLLDAIEILYNTGQAWDGLSVSQQKMVSTGFGIYQLNRFSAVVKGMQGETNEYTRVLGLAYDSTGSMESKYEEYSNTIEAANARMKASWEGLYINTIESGFIISLVNAGASILEFIDQAELLNIALIALGVTLIALKGNAIATFIVSMAQATTAVLTFGASCSTLLTGVSLLAPGLVALSLATAGLVYAFKQADEELAKTRVTAESVTKTFYTQQDSVTDLMLSISDLKDKQELTRLEQEKMDGVYKSLLKIMPEIQGAIRGETIEYDNLTEAVLKTAEAKRQESLAELRLQRDKQMANVIAGRQAEKSVKDPTDRFGIKQATKAVTDSATTELDNINAEIEKILDTKYTLENYTPPPSSGGGKPTAPDKTSGGSKSSTTHIDPLDSLQSYRDAVDAVTLALAKLDAEKASASDEEMVSILEKENEQYELRKKALAEYGIALDEQASKLDKNSKTYQEDLQKIQDEHKKIGLDWWENEKAIQANIKAIEELGKKIESEIKKKAEDANKELLNTLKKFDKMYDKQKDSIEERYRVSIQGAKDELEALKRKNQELEDEEERNKILLELEKARLKLKNILNEKNVKLYTGAGSDGWEWVADPQAVKEATESVFDLEQQLRDYDVDANRKAAEQKLQDEIDALERAKDAEIRAFEIRKQKYQDYLDNIQEAMDTNHEITQIMTDEWLASLSAKELESYNARLIEVAKYVAAYNAQIALLKGMPAGSGSGSGSGGSKRVLVGADGKAPKGLSVGDSVMTGGGTYRIDKVNSDGSYKSTKVDSQKAQQPKAVGGPVSAGQTYRVNEAGIEGMQWSENGKTYLRPLTNGKVITANNMQKMLAGSGGQEINIANITLPNVHNAQDFGTEMKSFIVQSNRFSKSRG